MESTEVSCSGCLQERGLTNESFIINKVCIVCQISYQVSINEDDLTVHRKIFVCGKPDFLCKECRDQGWYSTVGTGAAPALLNHLSGEKRKHPIPQETDYF